MGTEIAIAPERLEQAKIGCEALACAPTLSTDDIERLRKAVNAVSKPATQDWVRGRLATLLSHYYVVEMPDEMRSEIANDWVEIVMADPCPPDWAINTACRKWLGGPERRKKPQPGDIRELAFEEMAWVIQAKSRLFMEDHPGSEIWHPMARYLAPKPETDETRTAIKALNINMKGWE